jgi:Protein of unknown function (DUF4236)
MGFLRKSVKVGPLRFNLSKSGVSVSTGITGLRFGVGPRGNWIRMGSGGLSYRAALSPAAPAKFKPSPVPQSDLPILDGTHAPLEEIESADVSRIVDSSSRELLDELNSKRKKMRLWPWVSVASVWLFWLAASSSWPSWGLTLLVLTCLAAIYAAHTRDTLAKTTVLLYEFDPELEKTYAQLHEATSQLASCAKAWHIEASGKVYDKKYHAGASNLLQRKPTSITKAEPPFVKTNVETIAIGVGRQTLYFFPDRVLVYDVNGVGAVNYSSLQISVNPTRFIEEDGVPRDAEVVDRTWRYVNKSGGPDKRFKDNRQIPICRYEQISLSSSTGLNEILQVSKCGFGERFSIVIALLAKSIN